MNRTVYRFSPAGVRKVVLCIPFCPGPWSRATHSALRLAGVLPQVCHFLTNKMEKENRQQERLRFSKAAAAGLCLVTRRNRVPGCGVPQTGDREKALDILASACSSGYCALPLNAAFPDNKLKYDCRLIRMYGLSCASKVTGTE